MIIERHCEHHDEGCTVLRSLLVQALDSFEGDWVRISVLTIHRRQQPQGQGLEHEPSLGQEEMPTERQGQGQGQGQGLAQGQRCTVRGIVHTLNGHLAPPGTHLNEQVFRASGIHLDRLHTREGSSDGGVDVDAAAGLSGGCGRGHDRFGRMLEGETTSSSMGPPARVPMAVESVAREPGPGPGRELGQEPEQELGQAMIVVVGGEDASMENQSTTDDVSSSMEKVGEKVDESAQESVCCKTTSSSIASAESPSDDQCDASILAVPPEKSGGADVNTDGITDNDKVAGVDTSVAAGSVAAVHFVDSNDEMDQAAVVVVCGERGVGGITEAETGEEANDAVAMEHEQGLAQGPESEQQSQGQGQGQGQADVVVDGESDESDVYGRDSSVGYVVEKDETADVDVVVPMEQDHNCHRSDNHNIINHNGNNNNNDSQTDSNNTTTASTTTATKNSINVTNNDDNVDTRTAAADDDDDDEIDALVAQTLSKYYSQHASDVQLPPPPSSSPSSSSAVGTSYHNMDRSNVDGVVSSSINDNKFTFTTHNHDNYHDHNDNAIHIIPSEHSMQSLSSESSGARVHPLIS